jgi:hypothetical protein
MKLRVYNFISHGQSHNKAIRHEHEGEKCGEQREKMISKKKENSARDAFFRFEESFSLKISIHNLFHRFSQLRKVEQIGSHEKERERFFSQVLINNRRFRKMTDVEVMQSVDIKKSKKTKKSKKEVNIEEMESEIVGKNDPE